MAATFVHAAGLLGVPTVSPDGSEAITGHSLRVTGAQGFARLGLDTWTIQLIGRWGSDAILRYIRAIPLERAALWAADAVLRRDLPPVLEDLVKACVDRPSEAARLVHEAASQTPPEWSATVEALVEPLQVAAVVASPLPAEVCWVRDLATRSTRGLFHIPDVPLEGLPLGSWKTRCGWRFGGVRTVATWLPGPAAKDWEVTCSKCAPTVKAQRKVEFTALAKGVA